MASSDAFSELPNFALEGDFPEDVELIPTQQLFFQRDVKTERYAAPVNEEELKQKFLESIPKKTRDNNKWGLKVWTEWAVHRNAQPETYMENPTFFPVPLDLSTVKEDRMNYWIARFITECSNDE